MKTNRITFQSIYSIRDNGAFIRYPFADGNRHAYSRYVWDEEKRHNITVITVNLATFTKSRICTNLNQEGVVAKKYFFKAEAIIFDHMKAECKYIFVVSVDDCAGGSQLFHETAKEELVLVLMGKGYMPNLDFEMEGITEDEALSIIECK